MDKFKLQNGSSRSLGNPLPARTLVVQNDHFRRYFNVVVESRRLVFFIFFAVVALGSLYAVIKKPVLEANMLIQILDGSNGGVSASSNDRAALQDSRHNVLSEIELLRSRAVIGAAVDRLALNIIAEPRFFPIVGRSVAARWPDSFPGRTSGFLRGYAWGNDEIVVKQFEVPKSLLSVNFVITNGTGSTFRLTSRASGLDFIGRTGVLSQFYSQSGAITLWVDHITAPPGAQFSLLRKPTLSTIEDVQRSLTVTEMGKFSNIIRVGLKGSDSKGTFELLRTIGNEYLLRGQERKTTAIAKSLAMAYSELPELKKRMEVAELNYNAMRKLHGVGNVNDAAALRLKNLSASNDRITDLERRRLELRVKFNSSHPLIIGIDEQLQAARSENLAFASAVRKFPNIEQELESLAKEAKINSDMYTSVLRNSKELNLILKTRSNDIQFVDPAAEPVDRLDSVARVIAISIVFAVIFSIGSAFLRELFRKN